MQKHWYLLHITIKKNDYYEDIYSANPLYQIIGKAGEHIEEKNGNKYWTFLNS